MKIGMLVGLCFVCLLAFYIRLAPSDARRWHVALTPPLGLDLGKVVQGRDYAWALLPVSLAKLDAVAMASPRTRRLAGSVGEGRITWISRSPLWGSPDYTTAEVVPQGVVVFARARFGRGDAGVNAARLRVWLALLS